jgi:hypothetical protein
MITSRMRWRKSVRLVGARLFFLSTVAVGLYDASEHPLTVRVSVDGDSDLVGRVTSYFSSSLRDLKDVTFTDMQPTFVIHALVSQSKDQPRYVLSFVVTSNLNALKYVTEDFEKNFADSCSNPFVTSSLTDFCRMTQEIEINKTVSGPDSLLQQDCSVLIADFDGRCLQPLRTASAEKSPSTKGQ